MDLEFCTVVQNLGMVIEDTYGDSDRNPDYRDITGDVTFTPVVTVGQSYKVSDESGRRKTVVLGRIRARIVEGMIWHEGSEGISLYAGGENSNPDKVVYRVEYSNLMVNRESVTLNGLSFEAVPGETIDLTDVTPVAGVTPAGIVKGDPFTYEDFTPEQLEDLKSDLYDGITIPTSAELTEIRDRALEQISETRDEALNEAYAAIESAKDANSVSRVSALEAMGGLSPESPADGQTANLVTQPDTLTRSAVVEAAADWEYARLDLPVQIPPIRVKWVETFQPGHGWTATNGTATEDSVMRVMGQQSLKVSGGYLQKTMGQPLDLSKNNLVVLIRVTESIKTDTISVMLSDKTSFSTMRVASLARGNEASPWQRPGEWVQVTVPSFINEVGGVVDMTSVRIIRISGAGDYNIQAIGLTPKTEPTISISFDDGYASVIEAARRSMTPRGLRGTSYTIPSGVGSNSGFMTMEQTRELHDIHGWDIQAHTSTYYSAGGDNSALYAEMRAARKFIVNNGFGSGEHFAWAGGQSGSDAELVSRKIFRSSRTVSDHTTETIPPARPHRLRAYSAIGATGGRSANSVKTLIDQTQTEGGWLHLVFHRITDEVVTGNDCSWADFEEILDYIVESGILVKTVSQALGATEVAKTDIPISSWLPVRYSRCMRL